MLKQKNVCLKFVKNAISDRLENNETIVSIILHINSKYRRMVKF